MTDQWRSAWEEAVELTAGSMAGVEQAQQATWTAATRYLEMMSRSYARLLGQPVPELPADDKRFADRTWRENLAFDVLRQSYLIGAQWLLDMADGLRDMSPELHKRLRFWTQQAVDALSPANFPLTNPEVLQETFRTGGQNLVRGTQNLLSDLQKGQISMVPDGSFQVGRDLAITPGQVVYRNDLIELIQYTPTTAQVQAIPILVVPPWVNKYYVMDLRPANSMFKYLVDSGFALFTISWKNPAPGDDALEMDLADYMEHGPLAALSVVRAITGQETANMVGYCAGGILLQTTLAYLAATGGRSRSTGAVQAANTATFFATHQDYAQIGDLDVFISEPEVRLLELMMQASGGYLDGRNLAATFSMLRANDLLWHFVLHNYLLGQEPPAFDLLYWNGDGTRVPARLHSTVLRELFLDNELREPGGVIIRGVGLDTRRITVPTYAVAGSTDHIVPWQGAFEIRQQFGGPVRFVLAESGHIAAIINPPAAGKRCYWTNDDPLATLGMLRDGTDSPAKWLAGATQQEGSWWPDWIGWLRERSGEPVTPPAVGDAHYPPLAAAPGTYVMEK